MRAHLLRMRYYLTTKNSRMKTWKDFNDRIPPSLNIVRC